MAAIDDTVAQLTTGLAADQASLDALKARFEATIAATSTQIADLQAQVAAGNVSPATEQALKDAVAATAVMQAQLDALDAASPAPAPAPAPAPFPGP